MTIRKKITLLLTLIGMIVFLVLVVAVHNFREFKINRELQHIIHLNIHELDNTALLLDELLISPNSRVWRQLRMQEDSLRSSDSFTRLSGYRTVFPLVDHLVEKRKDFLTLLDSFFLQIDKLGTDDVLFQQTASLLFVISHEMKSSMAALHGQIQDRIACDNVVFVLSSLVSLMLITVLLLFTLIWIRRGFLSRILHMDRIAGCIAHGDYSRYLPAEQQDELSGLARSFGVMQDAIQDQLENLASERDKFSTILASIGDAVVAVDSESRILTLNPVAERLTGWTFAEASGHYAHEIIRLFSTGTKEPVKSPLQRVLDTGEQIELLEHTVLVSRSGAEHLVQDSAAPVRSRSGAVEGAVLVFRDMTDHAQMQEVVAQNEKMMSVGGLAAGIAQEIQNPLSDLVRNVDSLEGYLNTARETNRSMAEKTGTTIESVSAYLGESGAIGNLASIREDSVWVLRILEKMLMFAGVQSAKKEYEDLSLLLDTAVDLARTDYDMKKLYDFRKIIIVRDYEKNLPPVWCDAVSIQQVFLNILRNGVQAMYSAKTDPPRFLLRLSLDADRHAVCVEISDNGPGMDEGVRKRTFEPFFTTREKGEGSGLGLSIAYFIVTDTHGGSIEVRSAPGAGARFSIYLPVKPAEQ